MLTLHVNDRDYHVEFTFEAAESEAVEKAFDYFSGAFMFRAAPDGEAETLEDKQRIIDATIAQVSQTGRLSIDFLQMGLLEHHGPCGDETQDILTRDDAKRIYKQYCKENPDDEKAFNTGLFEALKLQMETDGFFKRIGVDLLRQETTEESKKPVKVPQDHKKKQS